MVPIITTHIITIKKCVMKHTSEIPREFHRYMHLLGRHDDGSYYKIQTIKNIRATYDLGLLDSKLLAEYVFDGDEGAPGRSGKEVHRLIVKYSPRD